MGALEHLAMASNVVTMLGGLFTASLFLIWWFTSISDEANMFDEEAVGTTRELDQFNSYWTNLQATNSNPVVGISAQSMAAAVKKVADTYREFTSRLADSDAANLSKGQLFWQEHTSEGLRKRWRWIKHRTFLEKRVVLARNMKYQLIFKYIHLLTKWDINPNIAESAPASGSDGSSDADSANPLLNVQGSVENESTANGEGAND